MEISRNRAAWLRGGRGLQGLAVLAAVLACVAFTALRGIGASVLLAVERVLDGGALPSLELSRAGGFDRDALARVAAQPGVRSVLARASAEFLFEGRDGRRATHELRGVNFAMERLARPGLAAALQVEGRMPDERELALPRALADTLGVGVEDSLVVQGQVLVVAACVDGTSLPATTTLRTFAELRGDARFDRLEALLEPGLEAERAAVQLVEAFGDGLHAELPTSRAAAGPALRGLGTTIELGAWLALAIGLLACAAAARDRVRANAEGLELQRALGAGPLRLAAQTLGPATLHGALAGAVGALLGAALIPFGVARLEAAASAALRAGIVLDLPRAPWRDAAILAVLAAFAATLVAALGTRRPGRVLAPRTARWLGGFAVLVCAAIVLSGATRLHAAFRVADVACAALGVALLVPDRRGPTAGSLASAARVLACCGAFLVAMSGLRASLARTLPEQPATELAWLGLDTFLVLLALLGGLAALAFVVADAAARRDEAQLLWALGAGPRERAAMAFRGTLRVLFGAAALATASGLLFAGLWRTGPLRDAFGPAFALDAPFAWPHPAAFLSPVVLALVLAAASAAAARARVTAS